MKNVAVELESAYRKVLEWFFAFPQKEFGLNELSKAVHCSKTSTRIAVETLVKEDFLKAKQIGNLLRISCDVSHPFNTTRKISSNLVKVYESGVVDVMLQEFPNAKTVILFGSYRKGDDTEESDIDIAVEILDNKEPRIISHGIIKKFGYRENVKVNAYIFSRNKIDLNLFNNIANGIVLWGLLEVRP